MNIFKKIEDKLQKIEDYFAAIFMNWYDEQNNHLSVLRFARNDKSVSEDQRDVILKVLAWSWTSEEFHNFQNIPEGPERDNYKKFYLKAVEINRKYHLRYSTIKFDVEHFYNCYKQELLKYPDMETFLNDVKLPKKDDFPKYKADPSEDSAKWYHIPGIIILCLLAGLLALIGKISYEVLKSRHKLYDLFDKYILRIKY